jgi:hypothetical protein
MAIRREAQNHVPGFYSDVEIFRMTCEVGCHGALVIASGYLLMVVGIFQPTWRGSVFQRPPAAEFRYPRTRFAYFPKYVNLDHGKGSTSFPTKSALRFVSTASGQHFFLKEPVDMNENAETQASDYVY